MVKKNIVSSVCNGCELLSGIRMYRFRNIKISFINNVIEIFFDHQSN